MNEFSRLANVAKVNKTRYPIGTKIKLIYMEDNYAVPSGTIGTVTCVDDIGQIHMKWENGSSLALNTNIDRFEVIA